MNDLKWRLQNLRDKSTSCKKDQYGIPCTTIYDMSIESLITLCEDGIEELENAPAVNRWIPCSERQPEDQARVLVYVLHSWVGIGKRCNNGDWYMDGDRTCVYHAHEVSHWMPLPELPEEGGEQ